MKDIIVIGAGGYIGSRLMLDFKHDQTKATGIDRGIFKHHTLPKEVTLGSSYSYTADYFKDKVVVYLSSFHREPPGAEEKVSWALQYSNLMVQEPLRIAKSCNQMIYVSSMRALTDPGLYGKTKVEAERQLHAVGNVKQLRFGTVWGGITKRDLPFRANTALNFALTRQNFIGDHWQGFTTYISDAVSTLKHIAEHMASDLNEPYPADITNVIDTPHVLRAVDVRKLLKGLADDRVMQRRWNSEMQRTGITSMTEDQHAAKTLYTLHGLEVPNVVENLGKN